MKSASDERRRRSIRLKDYDYSQVGAYFVTICTKDRKFILSKIKKGVVELDVVGRIVEKWWLELPSKFSNVRVDEYAIMPNHFHGIITIVETGVGADLRVCPDDEEKGEHIGSPLHQIIQWFKTMATND